MLKTASNQQDVFAPLDTKPIGTAKVILIPPCGRKIIENSFALLAEMVISS